MAKKKPTALDDKRKVLLIGRNLSHISISQIEQVISAIRELDKYVK